MTKMAAMPIYGKNPSKIFFSKTGGPIYIIHTQMLLFNLVSFFSSNDGERSTVKKVQMIRRIPARCSGWDEAWSWITKIDCRTKYV